MIWNAKCQKEQNETILISHMSLKDLNKKNEHRIVRYSCPDLTNIDKLNYLQQKIKR